jgi:hypothetical protein
MDENEIRNPEEELSGFDLEDIIREVGTFDADDTLHDLAVRELMEDIPQRELVEDVPLTEDLRASEEPELLVWTPAPKEPVSGTNGDTVRIDTAQVKARTAQADVAGETASVPRTPAEEPKPVEAEPFSADWEPQYDQPIGEYVPPEPIIFRPRSRLSELKRKLMEGPEKRYNALSEKGVGKLQIAIFVSMLVVVLAVVSVALHRLGMVRENRMRLLVFGEVFAMLASALLCWERLADGIGALFRKRFNTDTLLAFTFAACMADGIFCLQEVRIPFCAAFCLEVLMCLWAEYQKRSTELCQMDTLRKATRLSRVAKAPACHEDQPGFFVSEGQPEDFMDTYAGTSGPQKALDRYALIALLASVAVAVVVGVSGGVRFGVRAWSAAILAACPVTMLICQSRPMWTLERRLHRYGAVICGWKGVLAAAGKAAVPVSDEDLLPGGSVKINGVKFYSGRNPDTIMGYATAVMIESGSCLAPLFEHMLKSRRAQSYEIDEFKTYGDEGYGAIICGESVLVGSQEFLKRMGIGIPPGVRVSQAVYVAIDGEFSCVFALAFGKLKGIGAGLSALCGNRKLTPVLASCNFLLNEEFIREKYRVDTRRMAFPSVAERERLAQWKSGAEANEICALTTQEGLSGAAFCITGARSLRTAAVAGAAVHILCGLVGLAAVLVLSLIGRVDLMTPANLLLLEVIWAVPGLMISEWTRNI